MVSIGKRVAGIAAAAAMFATVGPVSLAGAATVPVAAPISVAAPAGPALSLLGPISGAYQAGADAAIGGFNAGTDGAVGGWNAGLAAMGVPFHFTVGTSGPFGLHTAGFAMLP